jgi:hypothetical protein
MSTLPIGPVQSKREMTWLLFHDCVRVPDGRTGTVIGFYRRHYESVLVRFGPGEAGEFFTHEVERL